MVPPAPLSLGVRVHTMLSWDLEDWIADIGEVIAKQELLAANSLSPLQTLVHEIWLLNLEACNGGLSQYFCNRGLAQWQRCIAASKAAGLVAFLPFESAVSQCIASEPDPYMALVRRGASAENLWYTYQEPVLRQLNELCRGAV
jgi:hypothetical protein